jgi:hypothetical protein
MFGDAAGAIQFDKGKRRDTGRRFLRTHKKACGMGPGPARVARAVVEQSDPIGDPR